jgi:DNA polymerase III delta subunit
MPASVPPAAALFHGNQGYSVDQAAARLADRVLGDGPRDFTFARFDAAELLKPGAAEAVGGRLDAFQTACEALPLLGDRRVVRLDGVEAVRVPDRAAQNLQRALEALKVCRIRWDGRAVWVAEPDLGPGESAEETLPAAAWVESVLAQSAGPPVLHPRSGAGGGFALTRRGKREPATLADFLRTAAKAKFVLPEEAGEAGADAPSAASKDSSGRLHHLLETLLAAPREGLTLILTSAATRETDLSKPLLAALKQAGAQIGKFVTYGDYNPADWVVNEAQARALRLTRPVAEALIARAGNDLGRLAQELDRLALIFPAGRPPSEADLLAAVHGGGQHSVFDIGEKLGEKDLQGALLALEQYLDDAGEHPLLISLLARHFRQLALVHEVRRGGEREAELAAKLKLHPFIAKKVAAQASRFTARELGAAQRALAELDLAAKRGGHLTRVLFKHLIHRMCTGGFRRPLRSIL